MEPHNPYSRLSQLAITDQGFAFDPMSGDSYTLNDTAGQIIRELAAGNDSEQVVESLADCFLVDPDEVRSDVRDFIEQLRCWDLVGGST